MKKQMKLRNSILVTIILITATIVLILGSVSSRQFDNLLTERMVSDYQETVNTMQKSVETLITYVEDFTKYTALDEEVLNTIMKYQNMSGKNSGLSRVSLKQKWDKFSTKLIFSTSMIYSLDIYWGEDLVYSYYPDPVDSAAKNIPKEILQKALGQASPVWTNLLSLKQYRSYAKKPDYGFGVVKSVRDESAKRVGAIAVYVRESSFSDILASAEDEEKGRFYLVSSDNTILSAKDKTELYQEASSVLGLSLGEYKECIQKGKLLKKQRGKDPILYVCREKEESGIKLIGATTMTELGRQQRDLKMFIAILIGVSVALAVISAWFVSNRVTKPLSELMTIMEKIKKEGKNSHLRFPEGNTGEVEILGSRFNELMDRLDESMDQIYHEQRQRRHNEVRLLQAQIVPHFLYNTMGIISSFIKLGMTDKALTTIQNLVSFYRLSLSSGKEIITIKEEVELTHSYLVLQQLRYIEYMEYTFECDEKLENFRIPKLTIQPLVENVLHHGLKSGGIKCLIDISVTYDEMKDKLKISVYDNGAGISPERLEQVRESLKTGRNVTKSFGVLNINQRLALMYGDEYHMEIDSKEGVFTKFTLYLPKESRDEREKNVQGIIS